MTNEDSRHLDSAYVQAINEIVESRAALFDVPGAIEALRNQDLGRAVVHSNTNRLVGLVLPLRQDQASHVILLASSRALVVIPKSSVESDIKTYKNWFSPSHTPIVFNGIDFTDLTEIENRLVGEGNNFKSILKIGNDRPEDTSVVMNQIERAIACAQRCKDDEEKAAVDTATRFMKFRKIVKRQ